MVSGSERVVDDLLKGASKLPWFEVSKRLINFIDHFIKLAEQQKTEYLNERKANKEKLKYSEELIQTLRSDIASLKELNSTNPHR